jgi:hypothetical protein
MEKVEWGWVVFGKPRQFDQWQRTWNGWCKGVQIINNKPGDQFGIAGSNEHFEFSGYMELLDAMETEGPFIIVNDTWFKTHNSVFWNRLLRMFLREKQHPNGICGDIRTEVSVFSEKPSPYLSSWIFYLPNRDCLVRFRKCIALAIQDAKGANFTPEYIAYVEDWLSPKNRLYGWHIKSKEQAVMERKRRSIYMEHALNVRLMEEGFQLLSMGNNHPMLYRILRLLDRLQTRLFAWGFYPFA